MKKEVKICALAIVLVLMCTMILQLILPLSAVKAHTDAGDVNKDGVLNTSDVAQLRTAILSNTDLGGTPKLGDINEDGIVDITDLMLLRRAIVDGVEVGNSLPIGTYIKYGVSYTDVLTGHDFTTTEARGWRVLDPGIDNKDGTYSNVKLVSTGLPTKLNYSSSALSSAAWKGTTTQVSDYISKFHSLGSATNANLIGSAGLYYNFGKIVFNPGTTSGITNVGCYTKINNKVSGSITGSEFVKGNATEVHNLTVYEINQARNTKAGADLFQLIETSYPAASTYTTPVTSENDAAFGLFKIIDLNNYGYTSTSHFWYWLASPSEYSGEYPNFLCDIYVEGGFSAFDGSTGYSQGLRPVVTLTSISESDIVGE